MIDVDAASGGIVSIRHPGDITRMNWTSSPENAPWQPPGSLWGLGFADLGARTLHRAHWNKPVFSASTGRESKHLYQVDDLQLAVTRRLEGHSFNERYEFRNAGRDTLPMVRRGADAFGIYTPFNDHYTDIQDIKARRSHAHISAGARRHGSTCCAWEAEVPISASF